MDTKKYWNGRYKNGGNSGEGSYGSEATMKLAHIAQLTGVGSILDVGCGDFNIGKQVVGMFPDAKYLGLDISSVVVKWNEQYFGSDRVKFANVRHFTGNHQADLVLCLDVLFHILDEDEYRQTIGALRGAWKKYLVISVITDFGDRKYAEHVKPRKFDPLWVGTAAELKETVVIPTSEASKTVYVFERKAVINS